MKNSNNLFIIIAVLVLFFLFKLVIKDSIREDAIATALAPNDSIKKDSIPSSITDIDNGEKVWFSNTQHGIVFETPKAVKGGRNDIPEGTEAYLKAVYAYSYKEKNLFINFSVMDTYFENYDTKEGLKGAITNLLNTVDATDLNLKFNQGSGKYLSHTCNGSTKYKGVTMIIKGYCLFKKGRVYIIIGTGNQDQTFDQKLSRVFKSIRLI